MSSTPETNIMRLPPLHKPSDYIHWKRRLYAFIRKDDPELVGLSFRPEGVSQSTLRNWTKLSTQAKSNIVLSLGSDAFSQTRKIIDDDEQSAKHLWDELNRIYTTTSGQAVQNLRQKLDSIVFDESKDWNSHVSSFLTICEELATYDAEVTETEKTSKLIRSLPASFSPLAMISTITSTTFEKVVNAVEAELSRRANPNNLQQENSLWPEKSANVARTDHHRNRGSGRGRGRRSGNYRGYNKRGRQYHHGTSSVCHYCGKPGHFISVCRSRISDTSRGIVRKPNRGGRSHRGRGGRFMPNSRHSGPHYTHNQTGYNAQQNWQQQPTSNDEEEFNPNSNFAATNNAPFDDPQGYFHSNMAVREDNDIFVSTVAELGDKKSWNMLIDSGGTHNFFHSRSSFSNYVLLHTETVRAAFSRTRIIGKGQVYVPLNGGMKLTAYHTPQFTNNILSVSELSNHFDVLFSSSFPNYKGCFIFNKSTRNVIFETPCENGLYVLRQETSSHPKHALALSADVYAKDGDVQKDWHEKTGHPSADRYLRLSYMFPLVPSFSRTSMNQLMCAPCLTGKAKKRPILPVEIRTTAPLQQVHLDISWPFVPKLSQETYAVHFMESHTAKSDVYLLKKRSDLSQAILQYKSYVEYHFTRQGYRIQMLRLDQARENIKGEVARFCKEQGIQLSPSPPYAPESNGISERIVQEHWTRARVLVFASKLPNSLWGEAINHANWLRNRLPSRRIDNSLPILKWNPNTFIDFASLLAFGKPGFGFIYRAHTTAKKKLLPRSQFGNFVGMESDTRLIRMYVPNEKRVRVVRRADFKTIADNKLPGVTALLDGLARQHSIETELKTPDGEAEAHLVHCLTSIYRETPLISWEPRQSTAASDVPSSFHEACQIPEWADAIDREFRALEQRGTWRYVKPLPGMNIIKYKWVFKKKPLDAKGKSYLPKARCVARGDLQEAYIDFDPTNLYAPVAAHESLRLILAYAASTNLILEGGDISNAYLYGSMDKTIFMEQPVDSSGVPRKPNHVWALQKSLYGVRQAGNIWGSALHKELMQWGFNVSKFDSRVYFFKVKQHFIIIAIVVDDMIFAANNRTILEELKTKLRATFDVKLYGTVQSFIGWTITHSPEGIKVDQTQYAQMLLQTTGMENCNTVRTPLPTNADLLCANAGDQRLSKREHHIYRAVIGGLLYLSVRTRPDLSFSVGAFARKMHAPTSRHFKLLKRILCYVAGTLQYGLHYPRNACKASSLGAAVDADWGGDMETRRATTGYIIAVNGSPVYWKSKRQTVVTLSSGEAEYFALSTCAKTVSWVRKIYWEVYHQLPWTERNYFHPTEIDVDSTVAISISTNPQVSAKNKHIDLKYHHVRDLIDEGIIRLYHVASMNQRTDMMTKILVAQHFTRMIDMNQLRKYGHVEDQ